MLRRSKIIGNPVAQMLRKLHLHHVGPAKDLELSPIAERVNLITGDNGLGKSFLLESAWWALTRTWHDAPAVPCAPGAWIDFEFDSMTTVHQGRSKWRPKAQSWQRSAGRPPNPGLVLYARVDGSYSVWDPARNYRLYRRNDGSEAESPSAYQFDTREVLDGLEREVEEGGRRRKQVLCQGLIDDWTRWQASDDPRFQALETLLSRIGPDEQPLVPGRPFRPTLDDQRLIPTIRMPYDQDVPITYAPAGVRRMCKMAYLLTWALSAHRDEVARLGLSSTTQIILLVDEPETHLHPRWQRSVLPSLLHGVKTWDEVERPEVQMMVTTHSPMILASMEPEFDVERDALWKLDLDGATVSVERDTWHKRGDINRWLMSDVFDLGAATSSPAERILRRAQDLIARADPDPAEVQDVDRELGRLLPEMDPFIVRWRYYMGPKLEVIQT
ncbi:MAG: AAA family ATPase [Myxococcales bacterium]|nr:AAA family ATPase [Myxococcales bacterium]